MIGKGKSISHTKEAIAYGWNLEKEAKVVFRQYLVGENPKEIAKEFETIQAMNKKCKRNTFSFIISPTIEDGKRLQLIDFEKICSLFIKELKLQNNQAIGFIHNDKEHKHIHLYVNRISFEGVAFNDSFISKRCHKVAEKVAKQLKLTTIKEVQAKKLNKLKEIRKKIKNIHDFCIERRNIKNFEEYQNYLLGYDVTINKIVSKSNKLLGFRYIFQGVNLKGSEVHRSLSKNKLLQQLQEAYSKNKTVNTLISTPKITVKKETPYTIEEDAKHNNKKSRKFKL